MTDATNIILEVHSLAVSDIQALAFCAVLFAILIIKDKVL